MSLCFICLSPTVGHARRSFRTCETTGKAVFIKDFQFTVAYIHYLAESMVLPSNISLSFLYRNSVTHSNDLDKQCYVMIQLERRWVRTQQLSCYA